MVHTEQEQRQGTIEEKEYRFGDEKYHGKIKKCAAPPLKANERSATGWKIWSDGYKREKETLISPESRPVFVSLTICIRHPV